ncbi:MAG: DM13 domain-containing protein [Egibacteraceae bacterium]
MDDEFPAAQPENGAQAGDDGGAADDAGASEAPDPEDGAGAEPDADSVAVEEPAGPRALSTGSFASRNRYTVTGRATVFELDDGTRTLRLEDFESTNGPDLFVYLTAADSADSDPDLNADFVDLGVLRGNVGDQNYEIPADVDLDRYDSAVIWCRRFSRGFGAADLATAG